ncbi:MAG: ATP:cob(I)alamin adenosyltransferase [Candidatus Parcubacteria bacterium]|nr:MAG: ATP:cob(I)alamin adenosyltransferase [Candidatus Parcubacteria bacterium]
MYLFSRKGDRGKSVIGNKKISKDNLVIDLLGELDELNSLIGIVKNYIKKYYKKFTNIQNDIFIIQANVANLIYSKFAPPKLTKNKIEFLEIEISKIENKIKLPTSFVIPGKEINSSWLHYLRTVVRRAERKAVRVSKKRNLMPEILIYLNRLSSYFYALALKEVCQKKLKEDNPTY